MKARKAIWAIGDVQGCHGSLKQLLKALKPQRPDLYWFAGDLINRGPASLASLRTIIALGDSARCVLGNHDLHLLATSVGARKPGRRDTLNEILEAPDRRELIDWMRSRPLAVLDNKHLMVHAGVHPDWSAEQTVALASEVEKVLRGPDWADFLVSMYGNRPSRWDDTLRGDERLRFIVNALTRMRYLKRDGAIDFDFKGELSQRPDTLTPWFDFPNRKCHDTTVVFGHWSTLGLTLRPNLIGLDTGCVWGGSLTAVNLRSHAVLQVKCPQAQTPDAD